MSVCQRSWSVYTVDVLTSALSLVANRRRGDIAAPLIKLSCRNSYHGNSADDQMTSDASDSREQLVTQRNGLGNQTDQQRTRLV